MSFCSCLVLFCSVSFCPAPCGSVLRIPIYPSISFPSVHVWFPLHFVLFLPCSLCSALFYSILSYPLFFFSRSFRHFPRIPSVPFHFVSCFLITFSLPQVQLEEILVSSLVRSVIPAVSLQFRFVSCFLTTLSLLQVELDEIEARSETYPETRAFLKLLNALTDVPIPASLGAGYRAPGFEPYLTFLRDSVFLKFISRGYQDPHEKVHVQGPY